MFTLDYYQASRYAVVQQNMKSRNLLILKALQRRKTAIDKPWQITTTGGLFTIVFSLLFVAGVAGLAVYQNLKLQEDEQVQLVTGFPDTEVKYQRLSDYPANTAVSYKKLPQDLAPSWYILYLQPYVSEMNYTGLVKIRIRCLRTTRKIVINSAHHKVQKISIRTVNVTDIKDIQVDEHHYNKQSETLVLSLNQILIQSYDYDVYIGFIGNMSTYETSGMYITNYKDESGNILPMLMSNFKPTFARRVFPCFDEPIYKATFQLILSHDKSLSAYSNAPKSHVTPIMGTKYVETHFQTSPQMSTYHLTYVIAKYIYRKEAIGGNKHQVDLLSPKDREYETKTAAFVTPSFMNYFAETFKHSNYTIPRFVLSPVTRIISDTSESMDLVNVYEPYLLFSNFTGSSAALENVVHAIGQAIASQYFGCLLTTQSWLDEWLFTSLSTYLGFAPIPLLYSSWDIQAMFYKRLVNDELVSDATSYGLPVAVTDDKNLIKNFNEYQSKKGAAVLHMFAAYVGEVKFNEALKALVKKFQYRNIGYADFMNAMMQVSPLTDVEDFLGNWLHQSGFPLVTVQPNQDGSQLVVRQSNYAYNYLENTGIKQIKLPWKVPSLTKYSCSEKPVMLVIDTNTESFITKCNGSISWYKFNYGGKGLYRVNYNSENWQNLLQQLLSNHKVLPVVDRANLIADIFELAYFNYKTIGSALDFIKYLSNEHQYIPYALAFQQLDRLTDAFAGSKIETCIKRYQLKIASPVFKHLNSIKTFNKDQSQLNALLTQMKMQLDPLLGKVLDNIFLKWLISGERNKIDGDMREIILRNGIQRGGWFEFRDMLQYYRRAVSVAERLLVLKSLAATPDRSLLSKLVESIMDANVIYPDDKFQMLASVCQNRVGRPYAWQFILNNWQFIKGEANKDGMINDINTMIKTCLSNMYSKDNLRMVDDFMQENNLGVFLNLFNQMKERLQWNVLLADRISEVNLWFQANDPQCLM